MGKDVTVSQTAPVAAAPPAAGQREAPEAEMPPLLQPRACRRGTGENEPGGAAPKPEGNRNPAGQHQRI